MRAVKLGLALAVTVALHAGCGDPPQAGQSYEGDAASTEADASGNAAKKGPYDPKTDPLVNPSTLLQPYDAAQATEDDWLYTTLQGSPATGNPIFASSTDEYNLLDLIAESPFSFDAAMRWKVTDHIVEKLDISDDKKVWTLTLRPGLKWHDGHPFTAHDIAFSWKEILDDRVPCPAMKSGTDEIELCEAVDDLTVRYVHKNPLPTSKWNVLFGIIPKHIYEKGKAEDPTLKSSEYYANANRNPVGNGPYRVVEWVEQDKIVLERWEDYPGPKPHFKRVVMRIIPDDNVQLLTFEKGETDEMELTAKQFALETVGSAQFARVGYKAYASQWIYSYICWNQTGSNPFFTDVRVRKAMTHATNIPLMIEQVFYNLRERCYGPFHHESEMYNPDIVPLEYDLAKAAKLLDEAGWQASEETGWREKDGVPFSFTLMLPQGAQVSLDCAGIMQQDLKSLGVELKTQVIEWATFQERSRKHEFQASMAAWGTGTDPDTAWNIWHSEALDKGRNYGGFNSPAVDALFKEARFEFDHGKRMKDYQKIAKLIYDEQPYTFLFTRGTLWAFNKRIRGVKFSPRGVWNFDPASLGWWVHKNQRAHGMAK